MNKDTARKLFQEKRQKITVFRFEQESSQLIQNTINIIKKLNPRCIHCFLPIQTKQEINTNPIIEYCWSKNIHVVVPISNFDEGTLKSAEFSPNTETKITKNNIIEPSKPVWQEDHDIDLVITPLLAFDIKGYRVGYGKGFYDRFFASLRNDVKRVGISLFSPCEEIENINEYDIPLTHCITPKKIYTFSRVL